MCIAAASPGPGDDFSLPTFRMETYIKHGEEKRTLESEGGKNRPQHALFLPQHSDFAPNTVQ